MIEVDRQFYEKMQSYISRVEELQEFCQKNGDKEVIREKYKILKSDIKEEAKYCEEYSNHPKVTNLVEAFYIPCIQETSAFGFEARINSNVNEIHQSLLEAEDKLTKYKDKVEWFEYK